MNTFSIHQLRVKQRHRSVTWECFATHRRDSKPIKLSPTIQTVPQYALEPPLHERVLIKRGTRDNDDHSLAALISQWQPFCSYGNIRFYS